MAKWMVYAKKADFRTIADELGVSPVTVRVLRNRDLEDTEAMRLFLHGTLADLDDPESIPGMKDAAFVLKRKIVGGVKIRVIGDYDVDGICSSYILWRLISWLGGDVSVAIPERIRDGYGINERLVREAAADGVDTIITCDNGIAAAGPLQMAKDSGMTVIVTDHHEIPFTEENGRKAYHYPPADVIAEPWIPDEETGKTLMRFPSICGAEVVFQLARILLGRPDLSGEKSVQEQPNVKVARELLGFAALATVCDVMPLQDTNRILVREGLRELSRTDNLGMRCLMMAAGLSDGPVTVYHAGFVLGPCLNASGRLDTAARALSLFQEKDENRAMIMARDLKQLNDSRKSMTEQGTNDAIRQLEAEENAGRSLRDRKILVIRLDECHESLAGIIAGRIKERYHRPTIVLTRADEDGVLKGSGRSIEAYDMFEEMSRCKDLFLKFGGHKMAAGLSLREENAALLDERLNAGCQLKEEDLTDTLHIDMVLPMSFMNLELVRELSCLDPCGTGNARSVFAARNVRLRKTAVFGKNHNVIRLEGTEVTPETAGQSGNGCGNGQGQGNSVRPAGQTARRELELVWFCTEDQLPEALQQGEALCHVAYEPQINAWKGREKVQFVVKDVIVCG